MPVLPGEPVNWAVICVPTVTPAPERVAVDSRSTGTVPEMIAVTFSVVAEIVAVKDA